MTPWNSGADQALSGILPQWWDRAPGRLCRSPSTEPVWRAARTGRHRARSRLGRVEDDGLTKDPVALIEAYGPLSYRNTAALPRNCSSMAS